jgi:tRNA G37 N-methylase Trm5
MFSRGNVTEKIRFGTELVQPGEVIVDLYGGIGYFTLPALVHGRAKHVHVCEWNSIAAQYLHYNLVNNGVADRATIHVGDCREVAKTLHGVADRVSLGLIPSSEGGWKTAVHCLNRHTGGWLHIHGNVPVHEVNHWAKWVCRTIYNMALQQSHHSNMNQIEWIVACPNIKRVKSFAPNVCHYVADVYCGPRVSTITNDDPQQQRFTITQSQIQVFPGDMVVGTVSSDTQRKEEGMYFEHCPETVDAPSCALSSSGILSQEWLRESGA